MTTVDAALAALLDGVSPVMPSLLPLDRALGHVAASMSVSNLAEPAADMAVVDGWACRSLDLLGATSYSPAVLPAAPTWVEVSQVMPQGCDCVLQADLVDRSTPLIQAIDEVPPGYGVRRAGEDVAKGSPLTIEGRIIGPADILLARKAGLATISVRIPKVAIIDIRSDDEYDFTTLLIGDALRGLGATVSVAMTGSRDPGAVTAALKRETCDLLLLIGGTGEGHGDGTAAALATHDALIAHGIALRPGTTSAIGRVDRVPVIALPGLPDQAFGGLLALVRPVLERLSGRSRPKDMSLPLARKIASTVGLCEVVLLEMQERCWMPLAVGDFSLDAMRRADAWVAVPGTSEGYATGALVAATLLHDLS